MAKQAKKAKPEIKNWYRDRYQRVLVERRLLAAIALFSLLCTLISVLVITQLIPLKTIEPYVIQVDQKSGITQAVDPMSMQALTSNEVVNNYFLVQYIRARESYHASTLLMNYDLVRVMSEPNKVYREFLAEADPNNPKSNVARLGSAGTRKVRFKSITYLDPQTVQVRMLIEETGSNMAGVPQHKIALVKFSYIKMNLSTDERYVNPLGFRVNEYRVDEDILQQ